jgi:hypothetical protein
MMTKAHHKQSGSVLIISLVMLVMLTLFVLTVINTTNINSRIARNMQTEAEAQSAVQQAIEQAISVDFTPAPASVAGNFPIDINNDGTSDYTVNVEVPACVSSVPIKTVELDISKPSDAACLGSGAVARSASRCRHADLRRRGRGEARRRMHRGTDGRPWRRVDDSRQTAPRTRSRRSRPGPMTAGGGQRRGTTWR